MRDTILAAIPFFPATATIREIYPKVGIGESPTSRRLAALAKEGVIMRERGKDPDNPQVIHFSRYPDDGA